MLFLKWGLVFVFCLPVGRPDPMTRSFGATLRERASVSVSADVANEGYVSRHCAGCSLACDYHFFTHRATEDAAGVLRYRDSEGKASWLGDTPCGCTEAESQRLKKVTVVQYRSRSPWHQVGS